MMMRLITQSIFSCAIFLKLQFVSFYIKRTSIKHPFSMLNYAKRFPHRPMRQYSIVSELMNVLFELTEPVQSQKGQIKAASRRALLHTARFKCYLLN